MPFSISDHLFQLPSVNGFIRGLGDELANRRSLLVLLPRGVDESQVWTRLRDELIRRDFLFEELSMPDLPVTQKPLSLLSQTLRLHETSTGLPNNLKPEETFSNLPEVLYLRGFDQISLPRLAEWFEALSRWARLSQSQANPVRLTALCLIGWSGMAIPHLPESDVFLAVHWWWGFPSDLEMHLLCRLENQVEGWSMASRWREDLLPAICGNDWRLIEYLWDKIHLQADDLSAHLTDYADQHGWIAKELEQWGGGTLATSQNRFAHSNLAQPPKEYWTLWSQGALHWTPEYGLELNSAALAALGRQEGVKHRLWRGQARLILPLLDYMRLELCNYLGEKYGIDWPLRWSQPESQEELEALKENPLNVQWGYLWWCLCHCHSLSSARRWLPMVRDARDIRNELSHYRPINFLDFKSFWRKAVNFIETISIT